MVMELTARDALTVAELVKRLGVSRPTIERLIARGELPSIRLGRRCLVPRVRYEAWLAGVSEGP